MSRTTKHRDHRRSPEREVRRAQRREDLLAAAVEVIRASGPTASMEAIAAAGGVTKPILYRHFGDRAGLVHAVAQRFADELLRELRVALAADADARTVLADTIDAFLRFVEREPEVYRFVVQQVPAHGDGALEVRGFVQQVAREVSIELGEYLRGVGFDSGAAEPWAYALVGMVHLAGDWWLDRQTMPRGRLVEYLLALSWDGLSALPVPVADELTPARALEVAK